MPTSTVRFHSLNADPLPDPSLFVGGIYTSFDYGTVVGGDDALDTADTLSSYVTVGDFGTGHQVITCRPVITPPIPAGAIIRPSFLPDYETDFAATLEQTAFYNAPTMPPFPPGGSVGPFFAIARASDGHEVANDISDGRDARFPPWNADWWDQTNLGSSGGPPVFSIDKAITQPSAIAFLDPSDYLVIYFVGPNLLISQFVGQITWEPGGVNWHNARGHYAQAGSVPLQIYTPPHGWVDIVDGPA